jgi:hypothetical protein
MPGSTLNTPAEPALDLGQGRTTSALGPSDSSDSGSDIQGQKRHTFDADDALDAHALEQGPDEFASDTDRSGTGERASADGDGNLEPGSDILPDAIDNEFSAVDDPEGNAANLADADIDDETPEDLIDEGERVQRGGIVG